MKLFAKEKDIVLKIVNSILIVGAIISIILFISSGINMINKPEILSYEEYAKEVCTIDKLEYEGTEIEKEVEATCKSNYIIDKKDNKELNRKNRNIFLISLSTTAVLLIAIFLLNKKM